jgi:hypothetical protein
MTNEIAAPIILLLPDRLRSLITAGECSSARLARQPDYSLIPHGYPAERTHQ